MTLLVTGASSYLATCLLEIAGSYGNVVAVSRTPPTEAGRHDWQSLDITDKQAVDALVKRVAPRAIVHLAACNPGSDETQMGPVNVQGAHHIASAARECGCRLVSVSSDTVLDGRNAPFDDNAKANPVAGNEYARTKALGEAAVLSACPNAIVVRTSLIYGIDTLDRGTAGFKKRLDDGENLKLFHDVYRQPVWIEALAESLCLLATKHADQSGIINVAGDDVLSRAEFGMRMLDWWGIPNKHGLEQISGRGIAGLPMDLRLNLDRARALKLPVPGVRKVLELNAR